MAVPASRMPPPPPAPRLREVPAAIPRTENGGDWLTYREIVAAVVISSVSCFCLASLLFAVGG